MSQRSSYQESDFAKPGTTTIESIFNAGHSVIIHKSMCMHPACAIIRCHADSCLPSLPEIKQCIFQWYLSCPSVVRIVGVFYHNRTGHNSYLEIGELMHQRDQGYIPQRTYPPTGIEEIVLNIRNCGVCRYPICGIYGVRRDQICNICRVRMPKYRK